MNEPSSTFGGRIEAHMRNIFVTGGAGFIGSDLIHYLQHAEPDAFIVSLLDALLYAANLENLRHLPASSRHCLIEGDIYNRELADRISAKIFVARSYFIHLQKYRKSNCRK